METLSDLKSRFEGAVTGEQLALTGGLVGAGEVGVFLDSLPSKRLTLGLAAGEGIRLSGTAYPQKLTVEGTSAEAWAVRGLGGEFGLQGATLVFTQERADEPIKAQLDLRGSLSVAGRTVSLSGSLAADKRLSFKLTQGDGAADFSLTRVVEYATRSSFSTPLAEAVSLFESLKLKGLTLSFGFDPLTATELAATLESEDESAGWQLIERASLKKLGAQVKATHKFRSDGSASLKFSGNITGRLAIGQEFDVALGIQQGNFWELMVYPRAGNVVPGLKDLAGLVGGDDLKGKISAGLDTLGLKEFSIKGVSIGFQLSPPKLTYVSMLGHLKLHEVGIDVDARLPNFSVGGRLSPDSRISLKSFAQDLKLPGAEAMPQINITGLSLFATPGAGEYQLLLQVQDDWKLDIGVGSFALNQAELDIRRSATGLTGSVSAMMDVAGLPVSVSATSPEGRAGWRFKGSAAAGKSFGIGRLLSEIGNKFGAQFPDFVKGIELENLFVEFDTKTKNFKFTCEGRLPVADAQLSISLDIETENKNAGADRDTRPEYETKLSGDVRVERDENSDNDLKFHFEVDKDRTKTSLVAEYKGDAKVNIKSVFGSLSREVGALVPETLEVTLKEAVFVVARQSETEAEAATKFLFGVGLGAHISLADLPVVGSHLPPDRAIGVSDLRFIVASKAFASEELKGAKALPAQKVGKGLNVSAVMQLGGEPQTLLLPVAATDGAAPTAPSSEGTAGAGATTSVANAKWFMVQKDFGPVHLEKVGVQYREAAIWFMLDAALSVASLTLSLDGLSIGSAIKEFKPKFELRGLGIDYKGGGALEIGGAFLRTPKEQSGKPYDQYDGAATIKAKQLTISAVGSYAELNGHPSLFIYAVLDYPIGGPSFFYVTGLAAGFGYNRALLVPPVEEVAQFPLVADALSGAGMPRDAVQKLTGMQKHVPPAMGQSFFAVGIKFTSFKVVNSFALLTVSLGTQFEVNLLGLSTLTVPAAGSGQPGPPLAEVQMALRATFNPARGFLGVEAQLTPNSYILSRDCHLTGGFAFYSWFGGARKEDDEHKGDFVLTLGGYHPDYRVPAHYPRVPRVGFSWRLSDKLSLKGGVYYALTAAAQMAGGSLEATWDDGDIKAHFKAAVNFIIYWQPYRYDATISVEIGGSVNIFGGRLDVNAGADLHIWGPEFAGTAHIDLTICSFDISFGNGSPRKLEPIEWGVFCDSFLPRDKRDRLAICGISVADGLLRATADDAAIWVVNPKTLKLVTNSVIPSKDAYKSKTGKAETGVAIPHPPTKFGVAPMGLRAGDISSSHIITISRKKKGAADEFEPAEEEFDFVPVLKNVPVALWGESLEPDINGLAFVPNTLAGFEVRPKARPAPGVTADVDYSALCYAAVEVPKTYEWGTPAPFVADALDDEGRRRAVLASVLSDETVATRARLLRALGINAETEVNLRGYGAGAFLIAPQVAASGTIHGTG